MLIIPLKALCMDVIPVDVVKDKINTLGLYQAPNEIVLHKEPSDTSPVVHSIRWKGSRIFPDSVKPEQLFEVYLPDKDLAFMEVVDETEDWIQVIYNDYTGAKAWMKKDDPYRFMTWIMFYNVYGRKYGLSLLKGAPKEIKDLHSGTDDSSQIVASMNMPQKINLDAIRGNWALVRVYDIDRTSKIGYIRWRSDDGVRYFFPDIK